MNKPATSTKPWTGVLTLAPMVSMFAGIGGNTTDQLHPAHKIVIGARAVMHGGSSYDDHCICLPAGVPHRILAMGNSIIVAFLDARRFQFEDVRLLMGRRDNFTTFPDDSGELLSEILTLPERILEPRIHAILGALAAGQTIDQVAEGSHLSRSRITHLLSEQFGTSPSIWRGWVRLREAIDEVAGGSSVTTAAHKVGFSDSSHFSRSCRSILGLAPSELAAGRITIVRISGNLTNHQQV